MRILFAVVLLLASASAQADYPLAKSLADGVILPTYTELLARLKGLEGAARSLKAKPTPANLEAARTAWRAARIPYERAEGFAFGPIGDYDPLLDTWPIDREGLEALLKGNQPLSAADFAKLPPEARGFHAVEYLLWGLKGQKKAAQLRPRELQYIELASADMVRQAKANLTAWQQGFYARFTRPSDLYKSEAAVLDEIIGGLVGIIAEIADEKLGNPLQANDPLVAESPFSGNSLEDYRQDLEGARRYYLGGQPASQKAGIGGWIAAQDPGSHAAILRAFDIAKEALAAIPAPFASALHTPQGQSQIRAAQAALHNLRGLLESRAVGLVRQQQSPFDQLRSQLRAVSDEYIGEGEIGEALEAFDGVHTAMAHLRPLLKSPQTWQDLEQALRKLEDLVRSGAPATEVKAALEQLNQAISIAEQATR